VLLFVVLKNTGIFPVLKGEWSNTFSLYLSTGHFSEKNHRDLYPFFRAKTNQMAQLIDGLYLHDILLMGLGALLFLVLLIGLIVKLAKDQPVNKGMQWFFVLPALMIAYPGTQRFVFSKGVIELEKRTEQVLQYPQDSSAREALESRLQEVESRPLRTTNSKEVTARANLVQGHMDEAAHQSSQILQKDPENVTAQAISALVRLDRLKEQLAISPADSVVQSAYAETVDSLADHPRQWVRDQVGEKRVVPDIH